MLHQRLIRGLREKAGKLACNTILYNWTLGGSVPETFCVLPSDVWPGDAGRGRWLIDGAFAVDGETLELKGNFWEPAGVSALWLYHMHGFDWLRDLKTLGGDQARRQARAMVEKWVAHYHRFHPDFWQTGLTGRRIANWIGLYDFFGANVDERFQDHFMESLIRQARHLSRVVTQDVQGLERLYGIKGLFYAGLAFKGREYWIAQALDALEQETAKQILSDGGHVSRAAAQLEEALQIYIDIRSALLAGDYPVPEHLVHMIDKMAQALRFFRYPDKKRAVFHGTQEGESTLTDQVLAKANARGKVLRHLPDTGFHRAMVGRSLLMFDTAAPPPYPYDAVAHAAPLAFEFMYGREKLFVNCGTHPLDPHWRDVLRGTPAHNALCLDHRNICEIAEGGHLGRRARTVTISREDTQDAVLLDASHDGYVPLNGITHRRRLYLSAQGHDLRGEENLSCAVGLSRPVDVTIRFHLHPRALVSLVREGAEALIRLRGGSGWRFTHGGGTLSLENSVYLGEGCRPVKTKQLVLSGMMESDFARIKWALRREGV